MAGWESPYLNNERVMKEKIKITIELPPQEPEPSSFVCALCKEKLPCWMIKHVGRHTICTRHGHHRRASWVIGTESWLDNFQISAASNVIKEIKNAART